MRYKKSQVATVVQDLDAAEAWVCLLDATGTTFEVVRQAGAVAETVEAWRSFPRAADLPVCDALDRREALVWQSLEDRDHPELRGVEMAHDAYVIAPLAVDTLTLMTNDPSRRLGAGHLALAEDLAARASLAMENARMHGEVAALAQQLQLAERYGIDPEDAFQHLRTAARRSRRKIHELARELVAATGRHEEP